MTETQPTNHVKKIVWGQQSKYFISEKLILRLCAWNNKVVSVLNKICSKIVNLFAAILLTILATIKSYRITESFFSSKLYPNKIYLQYVTEEKHKHIIQKLTEEYIFFAIIYQNNFPRKSSILIFPRWLLNIFTKLIKGNNFLYLFKKKVLIKTFLKNSCKVCNLHMKLQWKARSVYFNVTWKCEKRKIWLYIPSFQELKNLLILQTKILEWTILCCWKNIIFHPHTGI